MSEGAFEVFYREWSMSAAKGLLALQWKLYPTVFIELKFLKVKFETLKNILIQQFSHLRTSSLLNINCGLNDKGAEHDPNSCCYPGPHRLSGLSEMRGPSLPPVWQHRGQLIDKSQSLMEKYFLMWKHWYEPLMKNYKNMHNDDDVFRLFMYFSTLME